MEALSPSLATLHGGAPEGEQLSEVTKCPLKSRMVSTIADLFAQHLGRRDEELFFDLVLGS